MAGGSAGGSTAGGSAGGATAGGSAGGSTAGGSAVDAGTADAGLPACGGTLSLCGTTCLDTLSDENNCGGCGVQCSSGRVCNAGTCTPLPTDCVVAGGCAPGFSCNPVTRMCAPGCRINSECPTGATCNTTSSTCSCPTGQHLCGQACVPNAAVTSCGGSCAVCPAQPNASPVCLNASSCDFACNAGFLRCGNACTTCNPPPNAVGSCTNGTTCDFTCNPGFVKCGASCAPCTTPANASPICSGTTCGFTCNAGYHRCGDQCLPDNSVNSCGTRCTACPAAPGSTASCDEPSTGFFLCRCAPGSSLCGSTCVAPALATCSNRGTCADGSGTPSCTCQSGYAGATCNTCAPGFQDNDQNGTCQSTCATFSPNMCNGRGTCSDTSGTATCTCTTPGYAGTFCETATFVQVAAGGLHSCGLRSNGAVECWGSNNVGQTSVPAGLVAKKLVAGVWYTCALPTSGGVRCWGDAVGLNSMPMDLVLNKPNTGTFVDLFGGATWACAQSSTSQVTCFGANAAIGTRANTLSLGIGAQSEYGAVNASNGVLATSGITGTPPSFIDGYAFIDCGQGYCCAIRESRTMSTQRLQGAVQCWGSDLPTAIDQSSGRVSGAPALTVPTAALSAGEYNACAIRSTPLVPATDLALVCWGSTATGLNYAPAGPFIGVSVGRNHACAIDAQGRIQCWGSNSSNQGGTHY